MHLINKLRGAPPVWGMYAMCKEFTKYSAYFTPIKVGSSRHGGKQVIDRDIS